MSEEVNKLRAEDITHGGIVPYSSPEDAKASLDRHFSTIHYAAIGQALKDLALLVVNRGK